MRDGSPGRPPRLSHSAWGLRASHHDPCIWWSAIYDLSVHCWVDRGRGSELAMDFESADTGINRSVFAAYSSATRLLFLYKLLLAGLHTQ